MKRKLLILMLTALTLFTVSGCGSPKATSKATVEKYLDQRLTGNWMLSGDGYTGNDEFEYMTVAISETGKYDAEAKVAGTGEVVPVVGTYSVDKDGNLYIVKSGGEEILYYYTLQDGFLVLQYAENGTAKLKKVENAPQVVAEQPVQQTAVSIDLSAGKYVVGTDVPPGKYDITAVSGTGNFFGRPSVVSEMMGVDSDYYIPSYKNATFKNGNEIEISGDLVVNLTSK